MTEPRATLIITDANFLIDCCAMEVPLLETVARVYREVSVPLPVVGEVEQLDRSGLEKLGIQCVDMEMEQLQEAAQSIKGVSYNDRCCMILAQDRGAVCVTNDKKLRKTCQSRGIATQWGLEIIVELYGAGALTQHDATVWGQEMARVNIRITPTIMAEFNKQISAKKHRKRKRGGIWQKINRTATDIGMGP